MAKAEQGSKKLLVIDGTNYLFRSYHAIRDMRSRDGHPTNAIYGMATSLISLRDRFSDHAVACVMDAKGKTFRHDIFPAYKETRKETDPELIQQIEPCKDMVQALGFTLYCVPSVEADDVIATLARQAIAKKYEVLIATSDKDLMGLTDQGCKIINPRDNLVLDAKDVEKKFMIPPKLITDYLSLVGDVSDNVPGVAGVGPKTAVKWLLDYDDLDGIVTNKELLKGKVGEVFRNSLEQLALSKRLILLKDDVEIDPPLEKLTTAKPNAEKVTKLCTTYHFNQQLQQSMLNGKQQQIEETTSITVETLITPEQFKEAQKQLAKHQRIGAHIEVTGEDAPSTSFVGVGLYAGDKSYYIPIAEQDNFLEPTSNGGIDFIKQLVENEGIELCVFDTKPLIHALTKQGFLHKCKLTDVQVQVFCHSSLASAALSSTARRFLSYQVTDRSKVIGGRKNPKTFSEIEEQEASQLIAQWAKATIDLRTTVGRALDSMSLNLYRKVEQPVISVITAMEQVGIEIDTKSLEKLSTEFHAHMKQIEDQITKITGTTINLNSPKQMAALLYEKLGLSTGKKTSKGEFSTNETQLARLAAEGDSEIPALILEYRHVAKLVGTYTDALPKSINPVTKRVHTNFIQNGAVTGRMASTKPNLQNIPARTSDGQRIRNCFVAPKGKKLVSADYSQIELRILASFSKDETLLEAFAKGQDVHKRTAAELYSIKPEEVSDDQRRFAKTINFGLIYGMKAFGLAQRTGITHAKARELVDNYFKRLPGVERYLEEVKKEAIENKMITTLFGRRINLFASSQQHGAQASMLRAAVNAPMQGTAADIMKLAMVAVHNALAEKKLASKILLQVHDELIIEAPDDEVEELKALLPSVMCQVVKMEDVDLEVNVGADQCWGAAH